MISNLVSSKFSTLEFTTYFSIYKLAPWQRHLGLEVHIGYDHGSSIIYSVSPIPSLFRWHPPSLPHPHPQHHHHDDHRHRLLNLRVI